MTTSTLSPKEAARRGLSVFGTMGFSAGVWLTMGINEMFWGSWLAPIFVVMGLGSAGLAVVFGWAIRRNIEAA